MKHAGTAFLVVMLLSTLGLWGIAQQKNGAYASRLRDLEARHSKLEDEQRAFAAQAEKNQRRIATLESEKSDLTATVNELKSVVAERDEARQQLVVRTQERDEVQGQLTTRTQERDDVKNQLAVRTKERNDLRTQLTTRTLERDQAAGDLKSFTQELQSLLSRMETATSSTRPNTTEAIPASRRSE